MIVGISGKKQSGKDTACRALQYLIYFKQKKLGPIHKIEDWVMDTSLNPYELERITGWYQKKFADCPKDIVCMLIGCTREDLEDNEFKETPLGNEWKRTITSVPFGAGEEVIKKRDYAVKYKGVYVIPEGESADIIYYNPTPRNLLQLVGTECGRQIIHPNVWVNTLMRQYKQVDDNGILRHEIATERRADGKYYTAQAENVPEEYWNRQVPNTIDNTGRRFVWFERVKEPVYPNWIITDVRFPNEAQAIKDKGGIVIRISRDAKRIGKDNHESETAMDEYKGYNGIISNNGTIEDLVNAMRLILPAII